jgi:hypothetical protein
MTVVRFAGVSWDRADDQPEAETVTSAGAAVMGSKTSSAVIARIKTP